MVVTLDTQTLCCVSEQEIVQTTPTLSQFHSICNICGCCISIKTCNICQLRVLIDMQSAKMMAGRMNGHHE